MVLYSLQSGSILTSLQAILLKSMLTNHRSVLLLSINNTFESIRKSARKEISMIKYTRKGDRNRLCEQP